MNSRQDEVLAFKETLKSESDRGCALMAGAFLDDQLKALLEKNLVQDTKLLKDVFRPGGLLGTNFARINFAYLLGRYGAKVRCDLHLIREIRNDFGHTASPLSFETPAIKQRCRSLYHIVHEEPVSARVKFIRSVYCLLGIIHGAESLSKTPIEHADIVITEKQKKANTKAADRLLAAVRSIE
jgi:hypothetical protein